jgi:CheY-like chemotaxis protein
MVPDVILLDIMMPNLDGYSTLELIKQDEKLKDTKVIFLSAKNNPKDIEKGLEMGADAYVTKPYSIKKLMQQIEEMFYTFYKPSLNEVKQSQQNIKRLLRHYAAMTKTQKLI